MNKVYKYLLIYALMLVSTVLGPVVGAIGMAAGMGILVGDIANGIRRLTGRGDSRQKGPKERSVSPRREQRRARRAQGCPAGDVRPEARLGFLPSSRVHEGRPLAGPAERRSFRRRRDRRAREGGRPQGPFLVRDRPRPGAGTVHGRARQRPRGGCAAPPLEPAPLRRRVPRPLRGGGAGEDSVAPAGVLRGARVRRHLPVPGLRGVLI